MEYFHIKFSDSDVELWTEYPNADMLAILKQLPSLIRRIDPSISHSWNIHVENVTARIEPDHRGVEMKLFGEVETGRVEEVQAVVDQWSRDDRRPLSISVKT